MSFRKMVGLRSSTEWFVRGLLAFVVSIIGYVSVTQSLANTVRGNNIEWAHAIAPMDGRITALLSQKLSGGDASPDDRRRADQLARDALRQDATAVVAVTTLGINAQVRGDTGVARRLLGYANALSRRDLRTQIWAIEDAVGRSDVPLTLHHYDIALRTKRDASNLLFPVLASALGDPAIRAALTNTMAGRPEWAPHFINYAAEEAPDPRAVSQFFSTLHHSKITASKGANARLINRLIAAHLPDDAWSLFASTHPGADRRMSRDPDFRDVDDTASRLDWMLVNDGGVSTSIQHGDRGNLFDFSVPSSVGGMLLQQTQMLPPGTYRIAGRSEGVNQTDDDRPYWMLTCANGLELGRVAVVNSVQANGAFEGQFIVPAGCPLQILSLFARPSRSATGLSGRILEVRLHPAL